MKHYLIPPLLTLCLTACAVGPEYKAPQSHVQDNWASAATMSVSQDAVTATWWRVFNDPLLEKYTQASLENNKDIKIALANLRQARAFTSETNALFSPSVDNTNSASRSKTGSALSTNNTGRIRNLFDVGFDASWEIDIFGANRRAFESAEAQAGSALAYYQGVQLATLSEVARNYFEARGLQKRIAITTKNAKLQKQTYDVVKARRDVGEASEFDLSRSRGTYQLTRSRIPNLDASLKESIFKLSVLLGQAPEALLEEMSVIQPLPIPLDIVPVGLRSDILRRRPDVRMAEQDLAASVADIGVETAELFPKFAITGDIGLQAQTFGNLFNAANGIWSLGSLAQWSVFDGGAIRARIAGAEAASDAALASYEKAVLTALSDTETALTRYGLELETRKQLEESVQSLRQSMALAKELFDAGEIDYLAVLDSARELTAIEDDLVTSETQSITKLIALYTALGGGWETVDETL